MPLLQTLSITFTGAPIPFGKIGFPPKALQDIIASIKKQIQDGKDALNAIKEDFKVPEDIKKNLEGVEASLKEITANSYAKLANSCPALFSKTGAVATARQDLLNRIGTVQGYAANTRIAGTSIQQWADRAQDDTLVGAYYGFKNHVQEISGVLSEDKVFTLLPIPAYPIIGYGAVTSGSNTIPINLNYYSYPITKIGDTLKINTSTYQVTGKTYISANANVIVNANSNIVYSADIDALNLAEYVLGAGSSLALQQGMYIKVNNEIKRVNTVNSLGDYLTVYSAFKFNANSALQHENGIILSNGVDSTNSNGSIKLLSYNHANSQCLGDVINSTGTTFQDYLQAGSKIYYDEREFYVVSLTQTALVVDDKLNELNNQYVYKIIDEIPVERTTEANGPDDILASFSVAEQITSALGEGYINGLTTRYVKSDGTTAQIEAYKPVHVTKAVQSQGAAVSNRLVEILQNTIDDLQDDLVRALTDNELVDYLTEKKNEIESLKSEINDIIRSDKAAINALKGLIKNLLKLFKASCSKKKKGDDPEDPDTSSDDYLNLILRPNAKRQGCDANTSNLIDILDEADEEYNTVTIPYVNTAGPNIANTNPAIFDDDIEAIYGIEVPVEPGGNSEIEIDQSPDPFLPDTQNPCVEPC